jgi:hypothetical protein
VSAWSAWSACINGTETRTRTEVTPASGGGAACPTLVETRSCTVPVDCVVSAWSAWSACINGTETRTRTEVTPASGGGAACPTLVETRSCTSTISGILCGDWQSNMNPQTGYSENIISGAVNFDSELNGETVDPSGSFVNIVSYTTIGSGTIFNVPSGAGQLQFSTGSSTGEFPSIFINQGQVNEPVDTFTFSGYILTGTGGLVTLDNITSPYTDYTAGLNPVSYAYSIQCALLTQNLYEDSWTSDTEGVTYEATTEYDSCCTGDPFDLYGNNPCQPCDREIPGGTNYYSYLSGSFNFWKLLNVGEVPLNSSTLVVSPSEDIPGYEKDIVFYDPNSMFTGTIDPSTYDTTLTINTLYITGNLVTNQRTIPINSTSTPGYTDNSNVTSTSWKLTNNGSSPITWKAYTPSVGSLVDEIIGGTLNPGQWVGSSSVYGGNRRCIWPNSLTYGTGGQALYSTCV